MALLECKLLSKNADTAQQPQPDDANPNTAESMVQNGHRTSLHVGQVGMLMCGRSQVRAPGGVGTIVTGVGLLVLVVVALSPAVASGSGVGVGASTPINTDNTVTLFCTA
jgi:hypothetical protein